MGKVIGGLVVIIIVVLVLLFVFTFISGGSGGGVADTKTLLPTTAEEVELTPEVDESNQTEVDELISVEEPVPTEIIVMICEDTVTVNGVAVSDKSELMSYVDEIYDDSRTFKLVEENSILAAHEWVVEAFEEMNIELIGEL